MTRPLIIMLVGAISLLTLSMCTPAHAQRITTKIRTIASTTAPTSTPSASETGKVTESTSQSKAASTTPGTIYSTPTTPGALPLTLVGLCAIACAWFGLWLVLVSEEEYVARVKPLLQFVRIR